MFKHLLSALRNVSPAPPNLVLTGNPSVTIPDIVNVGRFRAAISLQPTSPVKNRLEKIHQHMLDQVKGGVAIYGTTTAYGAQARHTTLSTNKSKRLEEARQLSEAIIHVDVSTGPLIPVDITRAAMFLRINMLLPGYSAVRLSSLELLTELLNKQYTPQVGFFGTVGASGDLAMNGRVLSALLHRPETLIMLPDQSIVPANIALKQAKIPQLLLAPKEGLGFVNGDNFSTATAALYAYDLNRLMFANVSIAALTIQALQGSNRNFHPLLGHIRPHPGQIFTADMLLKLLEGSQLSIEELKGPKVREKNKIVQDPYSIRCLPQYFGPDWETLSHSWETININANSVSDNPLWTSPETVTDGEEPYQWVSGGNFLAMHMSDVLDKLRKIAIHIVKQNDRHLNRLVNPNMNNGLPANLSDPAAISRCTFKGLQTQMGMYEVFASLLAVPVSTAFGIHEELNQDITSHAMTSAYLTQQVLELTKLAMATNLMASCQAVDLRGGPELLSPATKPAYLWLRSLVPYVKKEQPLGHFVELVSGKLNDLPIPYYD